MRAILLWVLAALFAFMMWRRFGGKMSPMAARALVAEGALLLDVRSAGEFANGHLVGARNIPVGELASRITELDDKLRPIVVYCASGMRSASAAAVLRRAGFSRVEDLGGMSRWPSL
jgi:phage shock protein E